MVQNYIQFLNQIISETLDIIIINYQTKYFQNQINSVAMSHSSHNGNNFI